MNETFETRQLIDRDFLAALRVRSNFDSLLRLLLQLLSFLGAIALLIVCAHNPFMAFPAAILLGAIWASLFAPFHECTHGSAFRSRELNKFGVWVSGLLIGLPPSAYRSLHFMHHRYTQDPKNDPELAFAPALLAPWPTRISSWLLMISGMPFLVFKVGMLLGFSVLPCSQWDSFAPWVPPLVQRFKLAWESRIVLLFWLGLSVWALWAVSGSAWIITAFLISHIFEAMWLSTEHRGLPSTGSILSRTRTVNTSAFVSWWIWNMNFHAEHHGWPAVPWHQLPKLHEQVAPHLEYEEGGYLRTQAAVLCQLEGI